MTAAEKPSVEAYAEDKRPASPRLPKHILSLTSTRFIAAFAVVLFHFHFHFRLEMREDIANYTQLLSKLYLSVDFFFILSGFIMAHSYSTQVADGNFNFWDFMKRRFARIYPVHFVTLLAFCALGFLFYILGIKPNIPEKYALEAIPLNIFLLQAYGFTKEGTFNTPSWSISAEWLAYLLFFPYCSLLLYLNKFNKFLAPLISAIFIIGFYLVVPLIVGDPMPTLAHNFGILRILPEFFYGIAVYLLLCRAIPSQKLCSALWVSSAIAILLSLHFGVEDIISIFLFGLIIYALAARSCYGQNHILDKRIFVYGGEISYSMYMTHAIIYTIVFNGADKIFGKDISPELQSYIWIFAMVMVFPAAVVSFHLIEEPGRKFINARFGKKD